MLALIPTWLKISAVGLAAAALVAWGAYVIGTSHGRQQAAVAALERSVTILRDRNQIDEEVSSSDAAALCRSFGLSDDDELECLRRLAGPPAEAGDGRLHLSE